VREPSHPGRALVGTMLETVFRAALRRGAIFRVRKLSPSVEPISDTQSQAASGGKRLRKDGPVDKTVLKRSSKPGPAGAAVNAAAVQHTAEVKYLRIVRGDDKKLKAELISQLPAGASVFCLQGNMLVEDMSPNDVYWDVNGINSCPSQRIIYSLMKNAGAIDALLKDNPVEHLSELLFQFTVSLHHGISVAHVQQLRQVLTQDALALFFVVPNEHLFSNYRLQAYHLRNCPHGRSAQCIECAKADRSLTQYVLLCELPGWRNYEYSELGPTFMDVSSEAKSESPSSFQPDASSYDLPTNSSMTANTQLLAPRATESASVSAPSFSTSLVPDVLPAPLGPAPMDEMP